MANHRAGNGSVKILGNATSRGEGNRARRSKEAGGAKRAKGMLEVSLQPQITLEEHHK